MKSNLKEKIIYLQGKKECQWIQLESKKTPVYPVMDAVVWQWGSMGD